MNEKELRKKLVDALKKGADTTDQDLATAIGTSVERVAKALEGGEWPEGLELYSWRDYVGKRHYQLLPPDAPEDRPKPKAFRLQRAKDPMPYLRVFIPDDVLGPDGKPAEHIEVFPLSDTHWGHEQCDRGAFTRDVKEIERRPNRFTVWNGDNMDNSLGDSAGGAAWSEQRVNPRTQRHQLTQVFRPIAHKTFACTPGNHEGRSDLKSLMNPLEEICRDLGVPYFEGPYNLEVIWRGYRWTFHVMHGTGNSGTAGGKLNSANRPRTFNDFRHFYVSGHVHHQTTGKNVRLVRRREFDQDGKLLKFWKDEMKEYIVICPAYLNYDGTYAARWGLSPGSRNTVIMQLFSNGDYHVVTGKRSTEPERLDEILTIQTL